jgi:hypothetical protein
LGCSSCTRRPNAAIKSSSSSLRPTIAPQLIRCGTPGLDCDQSCIVCPLIRFSIGGKLSEFVNLTKLLSGTRYFPSPKPYTSRRDAPKLSPERLHLWMRNTPAGGAAPSAGRRKPESW